MPTRARARLALHAQHAVVGSGPLYDHWLARWSPANVMEPRQPFKILLGSTRRISMVRSQTALPFYFLLHG